MFVSVFSVVSVLLVGLSDVSVFSVLASVVCGPSLVLLPVESNQFLVPRCSWA